MKNHTIQPLFRRSKTNLILAVALATGLVGVVFASSTSNFTQTINAGSLAVDIVDASFDTVGSPSVSMTAETFSFACQQSTGTFGTNTQRIYVQNPDAADNGWRVDLAASAPTNLWDSAGTDYDFNEAGSSGCADDGATTDADAFGGRLTVDPSGASRFVGECASCAVDGDITLGDSESFVETSNNTIDLFSGASASEDIGDWYITGVGVTQDIPAEQAAAADYDINLVLSATAL